MLTTQPFVHQFASCFLLKCFQEWDYQNSAITPLSEQGIFVICWQMDVAKSELDIYKSQHETVLNQLKEAKDNLDKALETRTHRKR